MLPNESSASAPYEQALQQWNFFTAHEECVYSLKSILITVRLALTRHQPIEEHEERAAILQLLNIGETLAELECCRSDYEYAKNQGKVPSTQHETSA